MNEINKTRKLPNRMHPDYGCKGRQEDTSIYDLLLRIWSLETKLDTNGGEFEEAVNLLEKSRKVGEISDTDYTKVKNKLDALIKAVNEAKALIECLRDTTETAIDNLGYEYSEN